MSDLVARFKAGDPDAIRTIYRQYAGPVHTVARAFVRDREIAAEVVQQTFVKAWRAAPGFEGDRELAPWLYAIARRTAIDALRSESRPTRGGHGPEVDDEAESETFEQTWERFEIRRALDALPPDEREIMRRSHLLGETHARIAADLGVPIGTVKSRSNRAHHRLAVTLAHLAANRPATDDVVQGEDPR
jgi:RNA polymerase sigma-70 factor (ECF subfamily)